MVYARRRMKPRPIPVAAVTVLLAVCAQQAAAALVVLRGGSEISAPILKRTEKLVILDLGHDALSVPASEIVDILEEQPVKDAPHSAAGLYRVAGSARLSTVEASSRYAPAVVVVKSPSGLGSGFFVNEDGYLITNFHVIRGEKRVSVTRFVKTAGVLRRVLHREIEIVATAPFHDLAVLRVENVADTIVPVVFSPGDDVAVGETVFAIGNPLGLERTVTEGVISQAARNFRGVLYRQIDAPVNPGNSGGPLFNDRGQVIGIINMSVPTMEGLNFAIPAGHAKYVLDHLDAFAYDPANPETGYVYPDPPPRPGKHIGAGNEEE